MEVDFETHSWYSKSGEKKVTQHCKRAFSSFAVVFGNYSLNVLQSVGGSE